LDLIIFNGRVRTMDKGKPLARAVAIEKGMIKAVGGDEEILKMKDTGTRLVDAGDRLVLPGFIDAHMHLSVFGSNLQQCNLYGTTSVAELSDRVKAFIKEKNIEKGKWVIGKGWHQDYFDVKKMPTRYQLDEISAEHPLCLINAGFHALTVNSKALEAAGIDKNTPQTDGGIFDTDENGEPSGPFKEAAMDLIYAKLPRYGFEDIRKLIKDACAYANSRGITSVQTDDFLLAGADPYDILKAYRELIADKEINLRIYEQCNIPKKEDLLEFISRGYTTGKGDSRFKIGPYKLIADGNLGGRTAAFCEPYADEPDNRGLAVHTQESLNELVTIAHSNNMQVAVHCIGDKACYMAFEAFEKANGSNPRDDPRHTVVHAQTIDDALLDMFRARNVVASVQPIFLNYDLHVAEARLGKERAKTSYNWKTMLEKGVRVAFGSDCPVEPMDVTPGIYSAVTRKDLNGIPDGGFYPDERISVYDAVYGFTMGAAYASFEEAVKGSITVGKLADIVIMEEDIFEIPEDAIKDAKVFLTIADGRIVYENKERKR